jgi:serine/threonine protein kinase
MIMHVVATTETKICGILENILTDIDMDCDVEDQFLPWDIADYDDKTVSIPFKDGNDDKYWFKIFRKNDKDALLAFYSNDVYKHLNAPDIFDWGLLSGADRVFVIEKDTGQSIKTWLDDNIVNLKKTVILLKDIIANLEILHSYKFVHADISMNNITVDSGRIFLIDFETVHQIGDRPRDYFRATPEYAGTERCECKQITEKTDIQSFGKMLKAWLDMGETDNKSLLPGWLHQEIEALKEKCINDEEAPTLLYIRKRLQYVINRFCMEEIISDAKNNRAMKCFEWNDGTVEHTNKCEKYRRAYQLESPVYFACEEKSGKMPKSILPGELPHMIFSGECIRREPYRSSTPKFDDYERHTREIYLDHIVYAWSSNHANERISFISKCYKEPDRLSVFSFNTWGFDLERFSKALNKIVLCRENALSDEGKQYYSNILAELTKDYSNQKDKLQKVKKKIEDKLSEITQ